MVMSDSSLPLLSIIRRLWAYGKSWRFDPTVTHSGSQKPLQACKPEGRLQGTRFPGEERMGQRISLFLFLSRQPKAAPQPTALSLGRSRGRPSAGLLGMGTAGENPILIPPGGVRKTRNQEHKLASHHTPDTAAVGRYELPQPGLQEMLYCVGASTGAGCHSFDTRLADCISGRAGYALSPSLKRFMNKAVVNSSYSQSSGKSLLKSSVFVSTQLPGQSI